jgi:CBS domain-containing protein
MRVRVKELMSRDVQFARPDHTIQEAAKMMDDMDVGALPVAQDDRLVGMITDRDIAIRAVAQNATPSTKVRDVMTIDIKFCYDDEDIEHVSRQMGDEQVRRLPVVNRHNRLIGILALGDLANQGIAWPAAQALEGISRPGGRHTRSQSY